MACQLKACRFITTLTNGSADSLILAHTSAAT